MNNTISRSLKLRFKGTLAIVEEDIDGTVYLTRESPFSGKTTRMIMATTFNKLVSYYRGGDSVQRTFSDFDADTREFIMTGITPEE